MKQILVYSDSLTWGIVPDTRRRFLFDERWPGVMEEALRAEGHDVRTVEDCLNGRRTVFDDPYKPGRNGLVGVEQRIEINSPLALVILMLGTNDFQSIHAHNAAQSAQGIATLVDAIRRAPIEPGMPVPQILIVAPPTVSEPRVRSRGSSKAPKRRAVALPPHTSRWRSTAAASSSTRGTSRARARLTACIWTPISIRCWDGPSRKKCGRCSATTYLRGCRATISINAGPTSNDVRFFAAAVQ